MTGFPPDTVAFLADLAVHNDKAWFEANRDRYQAAYVEAGTAFVEALGPALDELVPGIHAEPRVLGSIFRIHRDTRFSKDKRPYKDHLDFWFWEGERKAAVSGLFLRIAPGGVIVGTGAHGFDRDQLARYRAALEDQSAATALVGVVDRLEAAGLEVGGETYRRVPRGVVVADAGTERLWRHSALYASDTLPAAIATSDDLVSRLRERWATGVPLHRWLVTHVQ
jgi:uncharacterized protein (TIGR02453 family)